MQKSLKRGTFVQEIAQLQQQLQQPGLTKAQHKKLTARLTNRLEKHNRNIDSANQLHDYYAQLLQHFNNGGHYNGLTACQQFDVNRLCNPFNPIFRHFNVTFQATDFNVTQVIKFIRKKINSSPAVRKYKTRAPV